MAKLNVYDSSGKKVKDLTTSLFEGSLRNDIVQKIVEIEKMQERQLYSPFFLAGLQTSASGNVKHNRHVWKTDRGRGLSRYPKKRMSDKGSQFVWVAAVAPGTRGGRRAHPPKVIRADKKINKKEYEFGFKSALAFLASPEDIKKKYSSLAGKDLKLNFPLIFESKILSLKSKKFFESLENLLGAEVMNLGLQNKETRPGVGKMRGRRYKKTAGFLVIIGKKDNFKLSGVEIKKVEDIKIKDLWNNGPRLVIFTEEAIKEMENKFNKTIKKEVKEKK